MWIFWVVTVALVLSALEVGGQMGGRPGGLPGGQQVGPGGRPHVPTHGQPNVPTGGRPNVPTGGRPNVPTGGRPNVPTGGRPNVPTGGRPNVPTGGRPNVPTGGRPNVPTGGRPNVPTGGRPRPRPRPHVPTGGLPYKPHIGASQIVPDKTCCGGIYNAAAGGSPVHMPTNCQDIRELGGGRDGTYTIFPAFSDVCKPVRVFCDQSNQGGGWTVIHRRLDGRLNFNRDWLAYRDGFGYNSGEVWLGNEVIHAISAQGRYELLVVLEDWQFTFVESHYRNFYMGSEATNYTLRVAGFTGGPGGDALSTHNGNQFSTYDRDNDRWGGNCAVEYTGAWWYSTCHNSNLNGQYLRGIVGPGQNAKGIVWFTFHGYGYSLKTSIMMIRPRQ